MKKASVDELIARFLALSIEQDMAFLEGQNSRSNRAIRQRFTVEDELKNRDGDARRLLIRYYEHPEIQVQVNAASATLALFPSEARRKLEQIRNWRIGPFCLDAGMTLRAIDDGTYIPK